MSKPDPRTAPFGSVFTDFMAVATYQDGAWSSFELKPMGALSLSPAAHALHYCSSCFEGFKAYRRADGATHVFRMDRHIERLRQSARLLVLPEPDAKLVRSMVLALVASASRIQSPRRPHPA